MQDIHGSIHIPIKHKAAGAAVNPIGKCFRVNRAASRAGLAGIGRVHQFHSLASVFSFVRQAVNKLAPRCIVDRLGKHSASQALHIQILQHDAVVLRDKPLAGGLACAYLSQPTKGEAAIPLPAKAGSPLAA